MNDREPACDDRDQAMIELLRLAGGRPVVPAERAVRVRTTVRGHWQARRQRRARRRNLLFVLAVVLGAGLALFGIPFTEPDRPRTAAEVAAVVERIDGEPQRLASAAGESQRTALSVTDAIRIGDWIVTADGARVALRFAEGTSVRLDAGSRARAVSPRTIELLAGAVFVDSGRESGAFEVRTPFAVARDIGTQFEIRLIEGALRLRVRTGVVELQDRSRFVSGHKGTEVIWTDSTIVRRSIPTYGAEWEWAARIAPPLHTDGMTLAAFLERVAREQGWQVRYSEPALAREAEEIILHGSLNGLPPGDAIEVAIGASHLRHRIEGGELVVLREDRQ